MDKIMSIKGTKSIFSNEIIFVGSCTLASVGVGEVMEAQRFANTSSFHQHLTSLYTLCFPDYSHRHTCCARIRDIPKASYYLRYREIFR